MRESPPWHIRQSTPSNIRESRPPILEHKSVVTPLEHEGAVGALLDEGLVALVDGGDREEDARARADGPHEVGHDGQRADAHAAEGGGRRDVAVELLVHRGTPVAHHHHLLVAQLPGDVRRGGSGHLDPGLGEHGARGEDEDDVEQRVQGVAHDLREGGGGRDVVRHPADWPHLAGHGHLRLLPLAQHVDEDVLRVPFVQDLGDEVDVGDEGGLEDDRDVRGVEQLDRVRPLRPLGARMLDRELHAEPLEVDDEDEDEDRREEVGDVRQVHPVERLLECPHLVRLCD
mmetsp:Transcript_48914/g.116464  ORF Transcript_48914/g.116464 Transcript_48914/m.116464 type:complete len:287 (-) Transcript_48914:126-986(-)